MPAWILQGIPCQPLLKIYGVMSLLSNHLDPFGVCFMPSLLDHVRIYSPQASFAGDGALTWTQQKLEPLDEFGEMLNEVIH